MATGDSSTHWTVILDAAGGGVKAREEFVQRYSLAIGAYLGARWKGSPLRAEIEDAVQEIFIECFKDGGVLTRAEPGRKGGFRAFLYGVARNVARRAEERWQTRAAEPRMPSGFDTAGTEEPSSRAFDRAWAQGLMRQATQLQKERANAGGEASQRRVELLRLRFTDGLPIRDIADRWDMKPTQVQYEYKCAREEFHAALIDVIRKHDADGDPATECARLLGLLAS